jgi:hypothetical protein
MVSFDCSVADSSDDCGRAAQIWYGRRVAWDKWSGMAAGLDALLAQETTEPVAVAAAGGEACAALKQDLVFALEERVKLAYAFDVDDGRVAYAYEVFGV